MATSHLYPLFAAPPFPCAPSPDCEEAPSLCGCLCFVCAHVCAHLHWYWVGWGSRFVAGDAGIPQMGFSNTADSLTLEGDGIPANTFFRVCESDMASAAATYALIRCGLCL
jgi:hypothetical protein